MGAYVNPGNDGFARVLCGRYVDKTGLIGLVNQVVGTPQNMVCITRPRRFGKSFAADSLVAYYCFGCDSRPLFDGLEISRDPSFETHLNAYNVVKLDMTAFTARVGAEVVPEVRRALVEELREEFPDAKMRDSLEETLIAAVEASGRRFVFVIDEWDAVFREAEHDADAQERYVKFLRTLFKNGNLTAKVVAAAYLTGILPIKRYGTQSAMTDFDEFTMIDPAFYAPYVGFTETEMKILCEEYGMDLADMRQWYDGYELPHVGHVYAPYSVMKACQRGTIDSYWAGSEAFGMLQTHIDMDFDGLQGDLARAVGGESLRLDPYMFQNDMVTIRSKDDALTLLVHLGYLAFDNETKLARIPNEEVRLEFERALKGSRHVEVARIIRDSEQLLDSLLALDGDAVAAGIERAHDATCAPTFYNNEQALRSVVRAALISAVDDYAIIEELPSGHGLADVVYLPKRGSSKPAFVVELKWNKPVESALDQIRERNYPAVLRDLDAPLLLVGITYDADTKEHACRIEQA